jgi:hypothetical protein
VDTYSDEDVIWFKIKVCQVGISSECFGEENVDEVKAPFPNP